MGINVSSNSDAVLHSYVKWGTDIFFIFALEISGLIINAFGILKTNKIPHDDEHQNELYLLWIIILVTSFFIIAWIPSFILFLWLNKEYKDYMQAPATNQQVPAIVG